MKLSHPLRSAVIALGLIAMGLIAVACGGSDKPTTSADAGSSRVVEVTMLDNRFEPSNITVARGEKVTFVFRNDGSVVHDAFVGDAAAQAMHETDMMGGGAGHDGHGGAAATDVTVEPGKTGTLSQTFDHAGAVEVGCHEPGHYAGGMKMVVAVS